MTEPLLNVRRLSVRFPVRGALPWITAAEVRAIDEVDLEVRSGETLGIVGESGCGKTTLGSAILGLQSANSGEISFDGNSLSLDAHAGDRTDMQVIFQDPFASLNPRRRVWKSVGEPLLVQGEGRANVRKSVAEIFEAVGLQAAHLERLPHEFSGGQRQRLAIARALVRRPRLVVCDEPVSALDVSVQSQILNLLNKLQIDFGLTYIFISHDLAVVKNVSDHIAVMYLGKIVETGPAERLFDAPAHPYTRALIDAIPRIAAGRRSGRRLIEGELPSPIQVFAGCPFQARCSISTDICGTVPPPVVGLGHGQSARCHHALPQNAEVSQE